MLQKSTSVISSLCRASTKVLTRKDAIAQSTTRLLAVRSYYQQNKNKSSFFGCRSGSAVKDKAIYRYLSARGLSTTTFSSRTKLTRPALEKLIERVKSEESMPLSDKVESLKQIGDGLLMLEKYKDSIEYYRRAIASVDENDGSLSRSDLSETYFALGYALHAVDELEEAKKALEKALILEPQHDRAYNQLGMIMAQQNKNDEAKALLERAISINRNNLQAHNNLGNLYQLGHKWSDAVYHYQLAVNVLAGQKEIIDEDLKSKYGLTADDLVTIYVNLAMAYNKSNDSETGFQTLNRGLDRFPENPRLLMYLGEAHEQIDAASADHTQPRVVSPEVMILYKRALAQDPEMIEARINIGMLQLETKNERAAEIIFLEALELAKQRKEKMIASGTYRVPKAKRTIIQMQGELQYNNYAFKALANLRHRQGRSDEAIELLKEAIEFEPNEATAYYQLGVIYHEGEKPMEAMSYLTKALKVDPTMTDAYVQLGICLANVEKMHEAVSCFKKAISVDPKHWAAHLNLSTTLMELGLAVEGKKHQEIAFSLYPQLKEMMSDSNLVAAQEEMAQRRMQETKKKLLTDDERRGKLDTVIPLSPSTSENGNKPDEK